AKYFASWQSRQATRSPCSTPSPAARAGCGGFRAPFGFDGTLIHNIAHDNWSAEGLDALGRVYPPPPSRETQVAEAILKSVVEPVPSATESPAQNKKLSLKTEVAKPLPIGLGDEQRLTQVLLNLVGNAIKFTDAGWVRVTAKAVNGHFAVSVADTGPGIPEHERARIFD